LSHFPKSDNESKADIAFSLYDDKSLAPRLEIYNNSKLLYSPSSEDRYDVASLGVKELFLYFNESAETYYLCYGNEGFIAYQLVESKAVGYIEAPESFEPSVIANTIFLFVLSEFFKAKDYFAIHSSALEKDGKGVLLPGFSGAGKTTTCIALARQGFGVLGDDRAILTRNANRKLELLGFPEYVNVTEQTANLFPELKTFLYFNRREKAMKKSFRLYDVYPGVFRERCVPKVILFPRVHGTSKSSLEAMPKSHALRLFLPHSMLVFNQASAKKHFDILYDLINATDCYAFQLGSDLENIAEVAASVL
jgi:hypothetical protein